MEGSYGGAVTIVTSGNNGDIDGAGKKVKMLGYFPCVIVNRGGY